MSYKDTGRDGYIHTLVIMALSRYCRNKLYRNALVLVVPFGLIIDTLVDLLNPTVIII